MLLNVHHTKWDGNKYRFKHKQESKSSFWRITLHSYSPTEMTLGGEVYIKDRIGRPEECGAYEVELILKACGGWTSIEEALNHLNNIFNQAYAKIGSLYPSAQL